jgi:hypothetical protein
MRIVDNLPVRGKQGATMKTVLAKNNRQGVSSVCFFGVILTLVCCEANASLHQRRWRCATLLQGDGATTWGYRQIISLFCSRGCLTNGGKLLAIRKTVPIQASKSWRQLK